MNSPFRTALVIALAGACIGLVGCSSLNTAKNSDFACDSGDCPTPLEVFSQTNHAPTSVKNGRTPESWKHGASQNSSAKRDGKKSEPREELRMDLAVVEPSSQLLMNGAPAPQPLREAGQVIRIWVAPYIDQQDNLNWSGYVYSDVTPRRWAVGEQEVRHQGLPPQFLPR